MRKWILVALMLFSVALSLPMTAHADTVFLLEKGSLRRIHGTIVRNSPGKSLHIQTNDGKVLVLNRKDIVNIISSEDTSPSLHGMSTNYVSPFMEACQVMSSVNYRHQRMRGSAKRPCCLGPFDLGNAFSLLYSIV